MYVICIPLLLLALLVGLGLSNTSETEDVANFEEELKTNAKKRKELFNAMERSLSKDRSPSSLRSQKLIISKEEELLKIIDKNNPYQVMLGEMLVARLHGKTDQEYNDEMKVKLRANPAEGFKAIKNLFEASSFDTLPGEKAALIALAAEIEIGSADETRELALSSLLKDIPPPFLALETEMTEQELETSNSHLEKVVLSNIAYEAYLKNSTDPQVAINDTMKMLELHSDNVAKESIVESFNQKFPSHDKELQVLATQSQINILIYQQREQMSAASQESILPKVEEQVSPEEESNY